MFLLLLLYTKSCKIQRRFLQLLFYHFYIFLSQSISNIEKSTIRDIKDSFHPKYYVESFISDKFPEKNELEEKINLSKQNVFLEMDKLNSEKNEIDSFTAQCTYILNQGLTK